MPLPEDANTTPNYTAAQHASHHNTLHDWFNTYEGVSLGGGGGGNGKTLLAVTAYNPGSLTTYTTTSTSSVDADATNLTATFTVPASGRVIVRLSALGNGANMRWSVREGSSDIAPVTQVTNTTGANIMLSAPFYITGLTPGTVKTYKWGFSAATGTSTFYAGGTPTAGAATMEVWADGDVSSSAGALKDFEHKIRTTGDITVSSTSWANLENSLDITLTAQAGDVIEAGISARCSGSFVFLDVVTVVGGSPVNSFGRTSGLPTDSDGGPSTWSFPNGGDTIGGSVMYTVVAGDVSSGTVTLRLRYRVSVGNTIYAQSAIPFQWWAKNLGQVGGWVALSESKGVVASRVAAQSIPNATVTAVSFDTEVEDRGGFFPGTGTTVTIPADEGGVYSISFRAQYPGAINNRWFFDINAGSVAWRINGSSNGEDSIAGGISTRLAGGTTIIIYAYQSAGGSRDLTMRLEVWKTGT